MEIVGYATLATGNQDFYGFSFINNNLLTELVEQHLRWGEVTRGTKRSVLDLPNVQTASSWDALNWSRVHVQLWPGYAVLGCWNQKSAGNSQIEEIQVVNLQNLFALITSPVLSAFPCIGVGHFHRFRSTIACKAISYSLPYQARWGSKSWMTYPTSDVHLIALGLNVDECWKFDISY